MALTDFRLRSTQQFMDELAARTTLTVGSGLIALVDRPPTRQRIIDVRRLSSVGGSDEEVLDLSREIGSTAASMPVPHGYGRSAFVTVIVRTGFVGWGPTEGAWASGWRYSNHLTDAMDLELICVTEHGWASLWTRAAGAMPAAA